MPMKYSIKIKLFDVQTTKKLDSYISRLERRFTKLPRRIKKFTLIRSPHVNKKSKEHFGITFYFRLLECNSNHLSHLIKLITSLPFNVFFKIKVLKTGSGAVR